MMQKNQLYSLLPETIRSRLQPLTAKKRCVVEEIRIRKGRPLEVVTREGFGFVGDDGKWPVSPAEAYRPNEEDTNQLLDLISNHSLYALEEELRRGFITVPGGHRIGISGKTVLANGQVKLLKEIGSFNIRIAHEVIGAASTLFPSLWDHRGENIFHTLILSPPQKGKTTLIRDLSRILSEGAPPYTRGKKIGIVDERSEIAAAVSGVPTFDVGPRTDVLDRCPKAEGMMMMIRSMSPDVLVVDEIGRTEDVEAIMEAMHAGIRVVATAHAHDRDDLLSRPVLKSMVAAGVFQRLVLLGGKTGTIAAVWDEKGRKLSSPVPIQRLS